jgi:hypothetical protein
MNSKREFAMMVDGTHPETKKFREYVLAELRCARQRAQLLVLEIETIGIALRGFVIEPEMAMEWLSEANALDFLMLTEPEWKYESGTEPKPAEEIEAP